MPDLSRHAFGRIDAHQHFWHVGDGYHGWIAPTDRALYRDFTPTDLGSQLANAGIDGTLLVQSGRPESTIQALQEFAASAGFVRGIVAPLEVGSGDVAPRIARYAANQLIVGFRPAFSTLIRGDGQIEKEAAAALSAMAGHGLVLDCLVRSPDLPGLLRLARSFPDLMFVINHAAKPDLSDGGMRDDWVVGMRSLGALPNVVCKFSGLMTLATSAPREDVLKRVVELLLDLFGPPRLLWGSDWPVLERAASYADWVRTSDDLLSILDEGDRKAVYGDNAGRIYRIAPSSTQDREFDH